MTLPHHLRKRAIDHATRLGVIHARERHAKLANPGYTIVQATGHDHKYWYFDPKTNNDPWTDALTFARNNPSVGKTNPVYIVGPDGTSWLITKRRVRAQNPPDPYYSDHQPENRPLCNILPT